MSSPPGMPAAKSVSSPSGFVQCSVHNARRKAECCEMKPVLNADMAVIDYVCVCKPAFTCKSASERNNRGNMNSSDAASRGGAEEKKGAESRGLPAPTPLPATAVLDASSTSMTAAGRPRGHAGSGPSSAAAGVNGEHDTEDVATLFSVSFRHADSAATAAPVAASQDESKNADGTGEAAEGRAEHDVDSDGSAGSSDSLAFPAAPQSAVAATATVANAGSDNTSPAVPAAPRARPRYYDLAQNAGGATGHSTHSQPVKVCWNCGMPGHEKPECPNTLCRSCHQRRGPYGVPHHCTPVVVPSPFIVPPSASAWKAETSRRSAVGEAEGMSAVRCVACGENGHFDCSVAVSGHAAASSASSSSSFSSALPPNAVPLTTPFTCCFCGVRGHTVFECRQRDRVHPDNFERRNQLAAEGKAAGGEKKGNYGDHSSNGPPLQQQQWSRPYGASSSFGNTRYDRNRSYGSYNNSNNNHTSSSGGGGRGHESGYRRERGVDDNNDRSQRGDCREGDRARRRYEAPSFSSPSSRGYANTNTYGNYSSNGGGYHSRRGGSPHAPSYGGSDNHNRSHHDRYDQRDAQNGGGGRSYGGRHDDDNRHDSGSYRREQRSDHGYSGRRGKNRDYDSGDDLF